MGANAAVAAITTDAVDAIHQLEFYAGFLNEKLAAAAYADARVLRRRLDSHFSRSSR